MTQMMQLTHPAGKKAVNMDKGKYETVRKPLMDRLAMGESTHTEILNAITEDFSRNKTKFEGSIGWHMEWVKLDLEARQKIRRVENTSPIRFALA